MTNRNQLLLSVSIATLISACSNREESPTTCERVRDHLVQLQLTLGDGPREDIMRRAMGPEYLAHCARTMSKSHRDCVIDARDIKTALACTSRVGNSDLARAR